MKFLKPASIAAMLACGCFVSAQEISVDLQKKGHDVPESLYGIFFEEINHAGDGGLYAELVKNRNFEEHVIPSGTTFVDGWAVAPHSLNYEHGNYRDWKIKWDMDSLKMDGWKVIGNAAYDVTTENQLDPATPNAMRLEMAAPGVTLENSGYWGMRIIGKDNYDLRFYVNPQDYTGKVTAKIVSQKGKVLAQQSFDLAKADKWQEFKAVLTPKSTDTDATLQLTFDKPGKVYVDYVSLFPQKTFMNRPNGLRPDVAQMIADLKPGFLRWPGGCIAEGATLENRAKWKETLGDPMQRHSEWILWNYHCSWGFGYHEFLQLCEDIGAAGMFVANVGLSCSVRNGDYSADYESFLQDIIDAIDYATAPVSNPWGAKRAAAGHPEPFNLKYVELGNEQVGDHYAERYNYFYRILKEKYPDIVFISTIQLSPSRDKLESPDMIDPHWYVNPGFFYENDHLFDNMERGKYDIYIGEYAVISEANMNSALSEAAFLTGVERNSDLVKMASYAPLFENHNRKDWPTNLIWYDNDQVMGRASYYVQQMYAQNRPDYNVDVATSVPFRNLTKGGIGFQGADLSDMVRNVTVKDKSGKVLASNVQPSAMKKNEVQARRRWGGPIVLNMLDGIDLNSGTIEFDAQIVEREMPAGRPGENRGNHKVQVASSFIFGAEGNDYFTVNIPQITGDRKVVTMNRATNGEANVDRNPGGESLNMTPGTWHKVRVDLADDNMVTVYIDGNKVFEQLASAPSGQYVVAGYDEANGETVIKVVNATDETYAPTINLNASSVEPTGKVITLAAKAKTDENSMEEPKKIYPVETTEDGFGKKFTYSFQPNSFTVIRLKSTK
ncbi:MAG: hypothetical protein NC102_08320 [Clostridium sp.]|nr:hypothetical protein [Clostridium sp.]